MHILIFSLFWALLSVVPESIVLDAQTSIIVLLIWECSLIMFTVPLAGPLPSFGMLMISPVDPFDHPSFLHLLISCILNTVISSNFPSYSSFRDDVALLYVLMPLVESSIMVMPLFLLVWLLLEILLYVTSSINHSNRLSWNQLLLSVKLFPIISQLELFEEILLK